LSKVTILRFTFRLTIGSSKIGGFQASVNENMRAEKAYFIAQIHDRSNRNGAREIRRNTMVV